MEANIHVYVKNPSKYTSIRKVGFTIKSLQIFNIMYLTILHQVIKGTSMPLFIMHGNDKTMHGSYYVPMSLT